MTLPCGVARCGGCPVRCGGHRCPAGHPVLTFLVDPDLWEQLEAFQVAHGFPSRAAAVKWRQR
jgi:hypothetical protein